MEKEISHRRTLANSNRIWRRWLDNAEYKPIIKVPLSSLFPLPSLSSLSQAITNFTEGVRQIAAKRQPSKEH